MRSMMLPTTPLDRRLVLGALTAAAVLPAPLARAQPIPARVHTLMVAGPPGGRLDRWADVLSIPIGRGLPGRTALARQNVGGLDGVTGANQFEARGEPDGSTALLVPGAAALSWLVGETRARFDPARWVPLWAGAGSAVVVSRIPLTPGRPLRLAAASPAGLELPALLALDLIGVPAIPSPAASADAMLLQGPGVPGTLAAASVAGMYPVLTLSSLAPDGEGQRDFALPGVPTALELVAGRAPADLLSALRAATLAVQLDAGLVLPQLTPASSVAQWRSACGPLLQDGDVVAEAARLGIRVVSASTAASCTSGIAGEPATLLALRRWLTTRYDWRPA